MALTTRRVRAALGASISLLFFAACEDDQLHLTGTFKPQACDDQGSCTQGTRLDAGFIDAGAGGAFDASDPTPPGPRDQGVGDQGVGDQGETGDPDRGVTPPPPPPPEFLNLAGSYRTHYDFDLSGYLLGLSNIAGPLDAIDQALAGNIDTGLRPLDRLITDIIDRYVPPWLVTVVDVLNSIANFFEHVEADGRLNIAQAVPVGMTSALTANEQWSQITVRIIDACPRGRNDPNYPACAQQRIPVAMPPASIGPLDVGVELPSFSGTLDPGRPEAPFVFTDREVQLELTKLIRVVADLAINIGTNGQIPSLEAAIDQAIDCAALQTEAERLALNIGLAPNLARLAAVGVGTACDREKTRALDAIIGGINGIGIGFEAMSFDQSGRAVDTNGDHRPEVLSDIATPDSIDGRFRLIVSTSMSGRWSGVR